MRRPVLVGKTTPLSVIRANSWMTVRGLHPIQCCSVLVVSSDFRVVLHGRVCLTQSRPLGGAQALGATGHMKTRLPTW